MHSDNFWPSEIKNPLADCARKKCIFFIQDTLHARAPILKHKGYAAARPSARDNVVSCIQRYIVYHSFAFSLKGSSVKDVCTRGVCQMRTPMLILPVKGQTLWGKGGKKWQIFAVVLYGWPLTSMATQLT